MTGESLVPQKHADYERQRNLPESQDKTSIKEQTTKQLRNLPMGAGRQGSVNTIYCMTRKFTQRMWVGQHWSFGNYSWNG